MNFEVIDGVNTLNVDMITTAAFAGILLLLGMYIRNRVHILERLCIPAPVIGGFLFAFLMWFFRAQGIFNVEMDTTLQLPFMLAFFSCVGIGGSFRELKKGGRLLLVFLVGCWILAVIQNAVGVGLASVLGIHPVLGVMAGTVSLVGGHGNAAAFGPVAENLGVEGAQTVAVAAATFGLVVGSIAGGPVGDFLIRHNKIDIPKHEEELDVAIEEKKQSETFSNQSFASHLTFVFIFMVGGLLISDWIQSLNIPNFALPSYVGAMFLAIIFRNINDQHTIFEINDRIINLILDTGLSFFLTMAMMTLKIWELVDLAVPILVILTVQFLVLTIFTVFILFPLLGKNYDAAVLAGGFQGWGMGIAATAVVCMSSICDKYGIKSTRAFLIAPLCGAVFVDAIAIPTIIFFMQMFGG